MPDPADLLKAWQHAIRDLGGIAASLASGPAGAAGDLVRPCSTKPSCSSNCYSASLKPSASSSGVAPRRCTLHRILSIKRRERSAHRRPRFGWH